MPTFGFRERQVCFITYQVEAETLLDAAAEYRLKSVNGDAPDEDEVNSSELVSVYQDGDRLPDEVLPEIEAIDPIGPGEETDADGDGD